VTIKSTVFCHVTSCIPIEFRGRFGGTYCLCLQGRRITQARTGKKATSRAWLTKFSEENSTSVFVCTKYIVWWWQSLICVCGEIRKTRWVRILGNKFAIFSPYVALIINSRRTSRQMGVFSPEYQRHSVFVVGSFCVSKHVALLSSCYIHVRKQVAFCLFLTRDKKKKEASVYRPRCFGLL
jgi:hypothetical protein